MNNIGNLFSHDEIERQANELFESELSLSEIILNTTYLFDTWLCAVLPYITDDPNFVHDNNLTADERFYFFLGIASGGTLMDKEYGGRPLFNILRHAYRLRGLMNRVSEAELLKEVWRLAKQFCDINGEAAPKWDEIWEPPIGELPTPKYPPESDAEAVEYVKGYFYRALGYCGESIGDFIEFLEEKKEEE